LDSGIRIRADTKPAGLRAGERCHVVVRPEKLRIAPIGDPSAGSLPHVEGIVESSLYLGTATQFVVRLPDEVAMTVLVPNVDESERQRLPAAGTRVSLAWASDHMHVVRETARAGDFEQDDQRETTEGRVQ
jgi:spermidine/putrescine transport system ATP-binding protein